MIKDPCERFDEVETWNYFDEVGMEFLDNAKLKFVVEAMTHLPRQKVWDAFANPNTWQHWFPKVECVFYSGATPYGVGTTRRSIVDGILYDETMLVWEEPRRWGYRINKATFAIAKAQLEITEFEAIASGTRVRWTLACDSLYEMDKKSFGAILENLLKEAIDGLDKYY